MKLIFATHNKNKFKEVKALIPENFEMLNLDDIRCYEDIPETSDTIQENAIQKATYIYNKYKLNCFADDTGLEVESLNNEPGVYSARYAGNQKNSEDNIKKLLLNLKSINNRKARFITVICLILNGKTHLFEGVIKGEIIMEKRGKNGFGYDPVFIPEGYDLTFAQLPLKIKNKISHRGKAMKKLITFLNDIK
ncbi:non-canonical purine NTP diphosphatase [Abyssalbus ytuae]|uniref:dITP/XTP pyrophosphatase n=1 Tax=Abyssalbus ytuae TaxID=2926907 RepID=A0A9E7D2X2_9FLAO|nr:non-canonical purine NTP diphosphatase [Abyssalbus ytuae]UOB17169.1 non-canonical purine NTP diphosphatase [Abyssalbus ytuae]